MKRLNLTIDLKENEVFEKETEELIRAKVREIVRSENDKLIRETAEMEFKRLFEQKDWGYRTKLQDTVKSCAISNIKRSMEDVDIDSLVQEKIAEMLEAKINWYSDIVDKKCKEILDQKVHKSVEEKLKGILN